MSTVHVDQDVNKHLVNAVNKLKTLQHVHVTQELSSHHNYGTEEPCIRDRFKIEMGLRSKDIRCQVVFDSSNYYFPPDIIFDPSVNINQAFEEIEGPSALLPAGDWDLKNENCLHDWFERLVDKLKKPPKSPSLSPPPVMPPRKKKNYAIFGFEDDSDDDFIIAKDKKADSDDEFIPMKSVARSNSVSSSNSKGKRPARSQHVEAKNTKRLKSFKEIGESKTYNVIDLDEEMAESSVASKQATESLDIESDKEEKEEEEKDKRPPCRNPYIDDTSTMSYEFDDKFKKIALEDKTKAKPQRKNPYIDEASTMNFEFDDTPINIESKDTESKAEKTVVTEKKKNPYIDEASTIDFEFDNKPKAVEELKKNPYIDEFAQMEIDKPEVVKKPKSIDLTQNRRRLTQGSSKEAAMRLQKETQWGDDFMALWRRRFEQKIMHMDEKDSGLLTLYMQFQIDEKSGQWRRYSKEKTRQVAAYREDQGMLPKDRVLSKKPVAPMLVKLELRSPTRLRVVLISVLNTRELESDEVDSINLTYDLNQENSVRSELNRIKNDIKEQAIHFHLFQTKLAN